VLNTLLANVDEGVHVVDRSGVTVLYNAHAGANDGLEPDEVIGRPVLQVFPSLNNQTSTLLTVLATGKPIINQQQTFMNFKGDRVTTINSTWPIFDQGELAGAVEISKNVTRVRALSEQVVELQAELLRKRRRRSSARADARYSLDDLIGSHVTLAAVKSHALRAASGSANVLVYGETGTGKELLVHGIHVASARQQGPLVAQNCAALPEGLLEGILFGTAKGSFTGAEDRPGLFELADGGTLYLDEINSMHLDLQAKLLRVLQDHRVRRVGDAAERPVDVRVIASMNEEPESAVAQNRMRRDLYYRLNVLYLELPPLRERRSDIPLLTGYFIKKHAGRLHGVQLSEQVERFFANYSWPGNVRELEHAIEAALLMTKGNEIQPEDLPIHLQRAAVFAPVDKQVDPKTLKQALTVAERDSITTALQQSHGNLSRAARLLGLPRQTLQYRIKVHGLNRN